MHKVYHQIDQIAGNVITVEATNVSYRELAQVTSRQGTSLAQVIRLEGDRVSLQVFAGGRGISTDAKVRFLGHPMQTPFSEALLGRVFTGSGRPRDKGPEITENMIPIGGPSVNPAKRIIPRNMVRTGIPMIDVFNSLVESQKLPVFSVAGEPYNPLLARIAMQAEVDQELFLTEDAELIVVAFGSIGRIVKSTVRKLRAQGKKVGLVRPITLFPFPSDVLLDLAKQGKRFLTIEHNMGQMVEDVRLAIRTVADSAFHAQLPGNLPTPDDFEEPILKALEG